MDKDQAKDFAEAIEASVKNALVHAREGHADIAIVTMLGSLVSCFLMANSHLDRIADALDGDEKRNGIRDILGDIAQSVQPRRL